MVASTYGSLEVLKLILSLASIDVNCVSGHNTTTALHCAASGGSLAAVDVVKALLAAGVDPTVIDVDGNRPTDIIVASPRSPLARNSLEQLLDKSTISSYGRNNKNLTRVMTTSSNSLSAVESGLASSPPAKYPDLPPLTICPCSRAYSHDWTECPFVHLGENARRCDPRKYHYSCVPCPDFRKGSCRRGDLCEYAHGVFESWLHPAQYRTRLCKDGINCSRQVCFFAHTNVELHPLHMSTGSMDPSPRAASSAAMEMAVAMGFIPRSPSAVMASFTPPILPSVNGSGHSLGWPQPNMPTLNLPASNLQSSRLRSSLNARDMLVDGLTLLSEISSQQSLNDMHYSRLNSMAMDGNSPIRTKSMNPANLDGIFSAEMTLSPRCNSDHGGIFSPSNNNAMLSQFHNLQQQQSLLSPINTNVYSPNISSPGVMSPRSIEPISPLSSRMSVLSQRERQQQTQWSLGSHDLGPISSLVIGSPVNSSLLNWACPSLCLLDWGLNGEELGHLKRSSSFKLGGDGDEHDVSWVHSLMKESPPEKVVSAAMVSPGPPCVFDGENSHSNDPMDGGIDQAAILGAWLEQMQFDQMINKFSLECQREKN
ncbi:hypothetical protein ZIOFF_076160 [Zingiber officinale]|uniref:C3H1-type domain-containing protein n=1 Tax=Zingiber officinale TaxID=94328 RepID=A0A8J5ER02_ZINOF|nr:hypothetical protein ZIOFF_076160 [Zingiber officinale]